MSVRLCVSVPPLPAIGLQGGAAMLMKSESKAEPGGFNKFQRRTHSHRPNLYFNCGAYAAQILHSKDSTVRALKQHHDLVHVQN